MRPKAEETIEIDVERAEILGTRQVAAQFNITESYARDLGDRVAVQRVGNTLAWLPEDIDEAEAILAEEEEDLEDGDDDGVDDDDLDDEGLDGDDDVDEDDLDAEDEDD